MKFIMVSNYGDGCHILWKIAQEGNDVELFITDKDSKRAWDGILPKVDTLPLEKDAIYLFDMSGNGKIAEQLKTRGYYVFGGSQLADELEFDRGKGIDIMHDVGMTIPETHTFKQFADGINLVSENSAKRWVFKASGKDLPCHLSHCQEEDEDFIKYMRWVEKAYGKDIKEFELQEYKEGVAVSTEGWFNGFHFIHPYNHTIEKKKAWNEDLGPATGCSGNTIWTCEEDALVKELKKMEPVLQGKYIGTFDLNCIVGTEGIFPLEFTPRMGYDSTCVWQQIIKQDMGQLFSDIARVQFEGDMQWSDEYVSSVRVTVPFYPADDSESAPGLPLQNIDINNLDDYYFYEIMAAGDDLVHSGGFGVVLCTVASDSDLEYSLMKCTRLAEELQIPNKQFRTDLPEAINEDFEEFKSAMAEITT